MKNIRKIEQYAEIIDTTGDKDDPYHDWRVKPLEKFIEELLKAGYTYEQIYDMKLEKEEGILIDYDLLPHENLQWDSKNRVIKLKMKYRPITQYKQALENLGINYDKEYWG